MNFILKFLDKTTSYANKYAVQREFDKVADAFKDSVEKINQRIDLYFDEIIQLNQRISVLEEKLSSQTKISLYPKQEPSALWQNTLMSTTDAIIHCLKSSNGEKLYYKNIYDIIQSYNLINKNVSIQSVKAILYQLARQKRIVLDNGTETGMFFIKNK